MSTQKRLILMLSGLLAILMLSIFTGWYLSEQRYADTKIEEIKNKNEISKLAVYNSSSSLIGLAYDNTLWDALAGKVDSNKLTTEWAEDNLYTYLETSNIQYIWIYNKTFKEVNYTQVDSAPKISSPIPFANFELALGAKNEFHFYLIENDKLIEVAGYTIHRNTDKERKNSYGFLFFGRVIGDKEINKMAQITSSKVELFLNTYQECKLAPYQIISYQNLQTWNETNIGKLAFVSEDNMRKTEEYYNLISLAINIFFVIFVLIFSYIVINKSVSNPLKSIMESLDEKDSEPIRYLLHQKDEFGKISKLIHNSFSQSKEIEQQYDKIQEQNSELEALNATKDKFFSIIAHDLRNPFGVILSTTEFISNPDYQFTKEELIDFSKDINHTAKTLFNLLENLLTWARSQRGNVPFEPDNMPVSEVIETTRFVLDSQADVKKITFSYDIEQDLQCFSDKNMMLTILRNLTSNAIKFTPIGGKIFFSAKTLNKDFVEFRVKDNGVGISPENLSKLFRIDVNVTTIGTTDEKGTGLGLILCKEFVEKNGGKIRVESEVNKGTSFIFTIPAAKVNLSKN